ncbi:PDZ domain (Also known as DHR or GLGF) domain-containing protein [Ditylenchus destructor]|nr:PDZ domain (Also known as DHR or GLGF) domain-containing protein [Ditylenchus destructor]
MINQSPSSSHLISSKPLEDYVTVLAIYDDPPPLPSRYRTVPPVKSSSFNNFHPASTELGASSSKNVQRTSPTVISIDSTNGQTSAHTVYIEPSQEGKRVREDVVEVTNLDQLPTEGLHVGTDKKRASFARANLSANSSPLFVHKLDERSSQDNTSIAGRSVRSVSMDPSPVRLSSRNKDSRKSRFTDAFFDAKERLEQEFEHGANISSLSCGSKNFRHWRIMLSSDTVNMPTGVEISAVPDPNRPNRLIAVEVLRIEDGGRIAEDGRLKVGDQITEINEHPCREMSLARARLYLRDLEQLSDPFLAFNRQIQLPKEFGSTDPIVSKPVKTALQQGNTSKIGETLSLEVKKGEGGFGFSFAGRYNAFNEHLFYVKTVKSDGPSHGILKIGDRLLEIDSKPLTNLQQPDITALLKSKKVCEAIKILVSRITENEQEDTTSSHTASVHEDLTDSKKDVAVMEKDRLSVSFKDVEHLRSLLIQRLPKNGSKLVELVIPLNESPSAGLGISLKAQRIYSDGEATDSGLYIRSILHGSAAHRDGHLRPDDRLIAIEDVNLLNYELNGEALEAFMKKDKKTPDPQTEFIINRVVIPQAGEGKDSSSQAERISSEYNHRIVDGSESDLSMAPEADAFVRDTATRKSISEKRPFGTHNDTSHLQTYQRIKHQRQTSAPAVNNPPGTPTELDGLYRRRRSVGTRMIGQRDKRMSVVPNENDKVPSRDLRKIRPVTIYDDGSAFNPSQIGKYNAYSWDGTKSGIPGMKYKYSIAPSELNPKENSTKKPSKFLNFFRGSSGKKSSAKEASIHRAESPCKNKENVEASPKRRSTSIEHSSTADLRNSPDMRKPNETGSATVDHRRIQSTIEQTSRGSISGSMSQPALSNVFRTSERVPLAHLHAGNDSLAHLRDARQRRKSTGGFLKLFQKSGRGSPENFRAGDEHEDVVKRNTRINERVKTKDVASSQWYDQDKHPSPQIHRRPPPPPYGQQRSPLYINAIPSPHNHQRMYSAQQPYHEQNVVHASPVIAHDGWSQISNMNHWNNIYSGASSGMRNVVHSYATTSTGIPTTPVHRIEMIQAPTPMEIPFHSNVIGCLHHPSTSRQANATPQRGDSLPSRPPVPPSHRPRPQRMVTVDQPPAQIITIPSTAGLRTAESFRPKRTQKEQVDLQPKREKLIPEFKLPQSRPIPVQGHTRSARSAIRPKSLGVDFKPSHLQQDLYITQQDTTQPPRPSHSCHYLTDSRMRVQIHPSNNENPPYLITKRDYYETKVNDSNLHNNHNVYHYSRENDDKANYNVRPPPPPHRSNSDGKSSTRRSRSKMRKSAASAVFYDNCEPPVRC